MSKDKSLQKSMTSKVSTKEFMAQVQSEYVKKYAQDVVRMLDDQKRIQKALDKLNKWLQAVEEGDYSVIDSYKKSRNKLEEFEDEEF